MQNYETCPLRDTKMKVIGRNVFWVYDNKINHIVPVKDRIHDLVRINFNDNTMDLSERTYKTVREYKVKLSGDLIHYAHAYLFGMDYMGGRLYKFEPPYVNIENRTIIR